MNITYKGHLHHQKQLFAHYLKILIVYPMKEQKDIKRATGTGTPEP